MRFSEVVGTGRLLHGPKHGVGGAVGIGGLFQGLGYYCIGHMMHVGRRKRRDFHFKKV